MAKNILVKFEMTIGDYEHSDQYIFDKEMTEYQYCKKFWNLSKKNSNGLIIIPCHTEDCKGDGEMGEECKECGTVIASRIVCINCGSDSPVGSHFGRVDAW